MSFSRCIIVIVNGLIHSVSWLSNIPLYIWTLSSLCISLVMDSLVLTSKSGLLKSCCSEFSGVQIFIVSSRYVPRSGITDNLALIIFFKEFP